MVMHAELNGQQADDKLFHEELLFAPVALSSATAEAMQAAWEQTMPADLGAMMAGVPLGCVATSADSVAANKKVVARLGSVLPAQCLLFPVFCMQHQAALVLQQCTKRLAFMGHLFCCIRVLQQGAHLMALRRHITAILQRELVVVDAEPDQRHLNKTKALLEMATGPDCLSESEAAALLRAFTGDITRPEIIHHCRVGCCINRDEAVEHLVFCRHAVHLGTKMQDNIFFLLSSLQKSLGPFQPLWRWGGSCHLGGEGDQCSLSTFEPRLAVASDESMDTSVSGCSQTVRDEQHALFDGSSTQAHS